MLKNDIENLEKVQRKFTKRLTGLQQLTYCKRLARLQLESMGLRRLRFDLLFTYKLIFGLSDFDCAVTTETAVISTNCSFRAPDLVSDITFIAIEQQECGMIYQLTVLIFLL